MMGGAIVASPAIGRLERRTMACVLCRWLEWLIERDEPGWVRSAEEHLRPQFNSDALFERESDPERLRAAYELWKGNPARAFAEFLSLAEAGSVWSMIQVGTALESGLGTPVDFGGAEKWYRKASAGGSDLAMLRVGYLAFARGDTNEARRILSAGAARGLTAALRYLAWMELKLDKTQRGRSRARSYYERAIATGDLLARADLAKAMARGRFGLWRIPAGMRSLIATARQVGSQIDARRKAGREAISPRT